MGSEGIGGQVIIDGFNMFDIITIIQKKNRRYIANALDEIEETLGKDSEQFVAVRKVLLDTMNDFTRSVFVTLFGNIEGIF
jgi:hypothetical protein